MTTRCQKTKLKLVHITKHSKGGIYLKFNYSKLRGRIVEHYGTVTRFCGENKMNMQNFSKKLNNAAHFSIEDVINISELLSIPDEEIADYFFVEKVSDEKVSFEKV